MKRTNFMNVVEQYKVVEKITLVKYDCNLVEPIMLSILYSKKSYTCFLGVSLYSNSRFIT